ncbi:hypothetical protein D3C83_12930 [compost metagenome]
MGDDSAHAGVRRVYRDVAVSVRFALGRSGAGPFLAENADHLVGAFRHFFLHVQRANHALLASFAILRAVDEAVPFVDCALRGTVTSEEVASVLAIAAALLRDRGRRADDERGSREEPEQVFHDRVLATCQKCRAVRVSRGRLPG